MFLTGVEYLPTCWTKKVSCWQSRWTSYPLKRSMLTSSLRYENWSNSSAYAVSIYYCYYTRWRPTWGGRVSTSICLCVCLFFLTISQNRLPRLIQKCSTMSPGNPSILGSEDQRSRSSFIVARGTAYFWTSALRPYVAVHCTSPRTGGELVGIRNMCVTCGEGGVNK